MRLTGHGCCRRAWSLLFGPVAALRGGVIVATLNVYGEHLDTATAVRVRSPDGRVHAAKIVARPEARPYPDRIIMWHPDLVATTSMRTMCPVFLCQAGHFCALHLSFSPHQQHA